MRFKEKHIEIVSNFPIPLPVITGWYVGKGKSQGESISCIDQTINSNIQENELTTETTKAPRIPLKIDKQKAQ